MRRLLSPGWLAAAGLVLVGFVVGVLLLAPADDTYIFLPDRARPVEPLVTVDGGRAPRDGGGIYFVDVLVRKATLMERLFPGIREGSDLVPAHALNPTGVSEQERRRASLREMSRSQSIAAAVALRELGYRVRARPAGALVEQVVPGRPADGKLHATDVIVAAAGRPVRTPRDLRRVLARAGPERPVQLDVRRGGQRLRLSLAPEPDETGRPVIGVLVAQAADIDIPISVRIDARGVGGPSAGLAFALDVLEELGRDVDNGYRVAVTGELELDGTVHQVGGVEQKTIGARRANAEVFIVPAGDNAREARRYAQDLRIIPVRSFQQTLRRLATLPPKNEK